MTTTISHVLLAELKPHPGNPKAHDTNLLDTSLTQFGYIEPVVIDARTGLLISGHGRREALLAMQEKGDPPPTGVNVTTTGEWEIPAVTGWASKDDLHAEAALIALNRIGEKGGWEDHALLTILERLNEEADPLLAASTGFDAATLAVLRRAAEADDVFRVGTDHLLDEFKTISGQETSDYIPEYARKTVVFLRDEDAINDFCDRLGIMGPLGKDLNYPLDWTPNDRRKQHDD